MLKKLVPLMMILFVATALFGVHDEAGTAGFNFLKINYSPRAGAMGEAYTGLSNRADAVFYNPAGLMQINGREVGTSYMNYFEGFQGGSISYGFERSKTMKISVFAKYMTSGDIDRTLVDEGGNYAGKDGTFGSNDIELGIGAGFFVNDILDLGVSLKYINETIDGNSASAVAVDVGLLHQTTNPKVKLGASIRNVGKQLTYFTDSEYDEGLPTVAQVGFLYTPVELLLTTLDVHYATTGGFSLRIGSEYQIDPMLALRAGYKSNADDWRMGGDAELFSGLSFGMGVLWRAYHFDYAVMSYGDLGTVHQLAVNYRF